MSERPWLRGILVLAAIAAVGLGVYLSPLRRFMDPAVALTELRALSSTSWAVPAYFAAYAVLDVLFIPTQFLSIAAVLMWGWMKGATIELIAATAGSLFPFLIARTAMRGWVTRRMERHDRIAELLDREGFTLLLLLRVVPIIPYTALNYVAGFSRISIPRYLLATLIGMIPSAYIFAYFVDAVAAGVMTPREVVVRAIGAAALFAVLIVATRLAAPRLRRRLESGSHTTSPTDSADPD
jgi:uncharacterized membrane protein YdjX (TVP38/TMEM64 family)